MPWLPLQRQEQQGGLDGQRRHHVQDRDGGGGSGREDKVLPEVQPLGVCVSQIFLATIAAEQWLHVTTLNRIDTVSHFG